MKIAEVFLTGLLALACLCVAAQDAASEAAIETVRLFDFESKGLADTWAPAQGGLSFSYESAIVPLGLPLENSPDGKVLKISSPAKGAMLCSKGGVLPKSLKDFAELRFWLFQSEKDAESSKDMAMEVQLLEADGKAMFWRAVPLGQAGWRQIVLPLRFFRTSEASLPSWDKIASIGFFFRSPGVVSLDNLEIVKSDGVYAVISPEELLKIAFANPSGPVRRKDGAACVIISDCAELDPELLAGHLDRLAARVRKDFEFLPQVDEKPVLLVFAKQDDYLQFPPQFSKLYNAKAKEPSSGGYTFCGIATSFWKPELGTKRPVYTHEFVHALLEKNVRIPNNGEWLQEGLANYYQMLSHPQDKLPVIISREVERTDCPSLEKLCSGERIRVSDYWQALSLMSLLLNDPKYREKFPALVKACLERRSTELGPLLGPVLGSDWTVLTGDWKRYCREKFPALPDEAKTR